MTISYKPLWKLLVDKDLKKKDLCEMAGLCNVTISRLTRGESVTTDSLLKFALLSIAKLKTLWKLCQKSLQNQKMKGE